MQKQDKLIFATLFFSIFAAVTGVGIVVPLLPVYARELGAGGFAIGLIFGAFSLSRVFFLPFFGRLSDKKGRKPLIVPGLLAYTLVSFAFLASTSVNVLIFIRLFQGIASAMLLPVIQAYVGDISPKGREGLLMGLFNMSVFFGLSIGPILGGAINDRYGLDAAFIGMGCLSLVGFLLSLLLLPSTRFERVVQRSSPPTGWSRLVMDREIAGLFFYRFAYTACIGIIWGFLPVLAAAEFSLNSTAIGFLVMLGVFVSGVLHLPMGYIADRTNKTALIIIGGLLVSYAVLSYRWAHSIQTMILASVCFGVGGGISMPALMAAAVITGDRNRAMGSVMALLTVAHSLGMLAGAMLAGTMMEMFKLQAAFPVGAALMLMGIAVFFLCNRRNRACVDRRKKEAPLHDHFAFYDESLELHHKPPDRH